MRIAAAILVLTSAACFLLANLTAASHTATVLLGDFAFAAGALGISFMWRRP